MISYLTLKKYLFMVSNRLGHSNIKTTLDVYTHLTEDKKKDVTEKFSKFMSM